MERKKKQRGRDIFREAGKSEKAIFRTVWC